MSELSGILPRLTDGMRIVPSILNEKLAATSPAIVATFWSRVEKEGIAVRQGQGLVISGEAKMAAATHLLVSLAAS